MTKWCPGLPAQLKLGGAQLLEAGFSPDLAAAPRAGTLPSPSVRDTGTVFAKGPADFLGDFPERRWATAFPEAERGAEFATVLTFVVFAYREQEGQAHVGSAH